MQPSRAVHLPADVLRAFGLGKLDERSAEAVRSHLDQCGDCSQEVTALAASVAAAAKLPGRLTTLDKLPPELAANPQYEILRELGRGGMGVVYLAKNKLMDRLEVLKVVNKSLLDHPGAVERFLREIRSAAKLNHPNVVTAYSALQLGELLAFAMEYVEGEDLAQVVRSRGPLPVANACHYAQQAALGLQHAFEKGMVHRDIKPQNLILAREGKRHIVKVLDFGLAKATQENDLDARPTGVGERASGRVTRLAELTGAGQMLGTPGYVAPEQTLDAARADVRADIYSLGCTLYYLLTGQPPYRGNNLAEILQAHQTTEARPLNLVRADVSEELAAVVRKMMAKKPAQRYQTPGEVVQALSAAVKPTPKRAAAKSLPQAPAPAAKRRPDERERLLRAETILLPGAAAQATRIEDDASIARARKTATPRQSRKLLAVSLVVLPMLAGLVILCGYLSWDRLANRLPDDNSRDSGAVSRPLEKTTNAIRPPLTLKTDEDKPPANKPPAKKPPVKNEPPRKDPSKNLPPRETVRNDPPRRPARTAGNLFPRRALLISVHDYLYANPIQNGTPGANANNLNNFINALSLGLHIPLNQIAHLSDAADAKYGPRAPTKIVIEQTLTKFLDTSRPQDRLVVFFIGHSVELDDGVYLAPIEGELDRADTLIPLKWLYEQLAKSKARQKVLVLDVNRYNRAFGQERPGGDEMGEKLDALLKEPPAGVQVWSSCIVKQRSFATDDFPMGIFLDSLLVALRRGGNGTIQRVDDPMPIDRYVEPVNHLIKGDLSKRKLEQVSRLTGKEAESGAAYDANQAPAPDVVTCLAPPPVGVELNKALVEAVLHQVGTPPVKVTHEMGLRYDALPPFPVDALEKYQGDEPNPASPLRKAVKNARATLYALYPGQEPKELSNEVSVMRSRIRVQLDVLKEGYRAPGGGNAEKQFKDRIKVNERKVVFMMIAIEDSLEELQSQAVADARERESKRWKANYDFVLARVMLERAYLFEYQSMLGSMCKEFPPRDPALHGGWKLASQPTLQGDAVGKKSYKNAQKLLEKIIKDNAGSPWEVLAKREKLTNLGLEWQPTR